MSTEGSARDKVLCYCQRVSRTAVEQAIRNGAKTLTNVMDSTGAGLGPCGGSCRENIKHCLMKDHSALKDFKESSFDPPTELTEAVSLFNRRYYWETHEVLEDLWMEESGALKLFYQGLIQAAAALYHVMSANPKGVIKLAEDSVQKLEQFAPTYCSIHILPLMKSIESYKTQAIDILGGTRSGFDYDQLPQLMMGSSMLAQNRKTKLS